jgi:AraC-like DNA-binding protein
MPKNNSELKPPAKSAVDVQDRRLRSRVASSVVRSKSNGTVPIAPKFALLNFRVARALALIESDYAVPQLNLDLISGRLNVTKPHLCRIFRREVGIGLPEYVGRMRAQKAEKLLKDVSVISRPSGRIESK